MRTVLLLFVCSFCLSLSILTAQNIPANAYNAAHAEFLETQSAMAAAMPGLCPSEPCPCNGGFVEMSVYYFGEDNVTVDVFSNKPLTQQIASFPGVLNGELLTLSGAGLPGGILPQYSYFRVTSGGGTVCVTSIYSRCPSNAWPGSLEDLKVIGKTFGEFTVYSHRDAGNNYSCTIDDANINQDWRVGGNVIGAANNTIGTLNDAGMVFITGNTPRGAITNAGDFGIGTTAPAARLDVAGDSRISQTLNVAGATTVGGNFTVQPGGVTRLLSNTASTGINSGALVVTGGIGSGGDLHTGGTATFAGLTRVNNNARITGNLNLHGRLILGAAETSGLRLAGAGLRIENETGDVRITAFNEEMMIVNNAEVEVKKRLIVTGADLAERFHVSPIEALKPEAGMVLSIDKYNPGKLVISNKPYDKAVAGIVSGAGGVNTAMLLGQEGTIADGDVPVAIVGRVFCHADASYGAIEPGDLLSTSATPGHLMKVKDFDAARGAVIGKAMTGLEEGKGLVLVLISMQ